MSDKKWCIFVLIIYSCIMLFIGTLVIVVDPYFHYHAPIKGLAYSLDKAEYRNDGISRHFNYDAMITGTSMTKNFRTSEAEALFGKKFIRITYLGEGFKAINDNLERAVEYNPDLKFVIRGVDPIWFVTDENWMGYEQYPEYLYDSNVWNDGNYIYNKDILFRDVFQEIAATMKGCQPKIFDDYVKTEKTGKKAVLEEYNRPPKENSVIDPAETETYFSMLEANLNENVLSIINDHPEITFYIFIPPYSICWWDGLNQYGIDVLKRRIDMERFAIEKLLDQDNVHLFSFFNNYDLICDFDNYVDDIHYSEKVNSQILLWMKEGKYELTKDNYLDYINEITEFYCHYDYDSIFND